MEAECADDFLNELRSTAKRKHVQWTHSRRRVEGSIIRRSFICKWKNIRFGLPRGGTSDNKYFDNRCSRQGTPCSSLGDDHCHEHDHVVGYWSQHHYWRNVANILRDEFGVTLVRKRIPRTRTYTDTSKSPARISHWASWMQRCTCRPYIHVAKSWPGHAAGSWGHNAGRRWGMYATLFGGPRG